MTTVAAGTPVAAGVTVIAGTAGPRSPVSRGVPMDALHPRLLVADFPAVFRFYDRVLPALLGATRTRGGEQGPYASWDVGGEGLLTLLDRAAMAAVTGTAPDGQGGQGGQGAPAAGQDGSMLVSRVSDVSAGYELALRCGGTPVAPPADRPEWGPAMRTAHVRDPEGNLLEFQSY